MFILLLNSGVYLEKTSLPGGGGFQRMSFREKKYEKGKRKKRKT
jgi:hypothetical protein